MLLLWILFLIIFIILLRYVYLIAKRLLLIKKIKKHVKKYGGKLCNYRHPLTSIFKHDGKTDFLIACKGKCIKLSVITTPFRRVRYHFDNNTHLEIIFERRGLFVANPKSRSSVVVIDQTLTLRKYKLRLENTDTECYTILHPAPLSITRAEGPLFTFLHNNDVLFDNVKICGLKYFLDNVI